MRVGIAWLYMRSGMMEGAATYIDALAREFVRNKKLGVEPVLIAPNVTEKKPYSVINYSGKLSDSVMNYPLAVASCLNSVRKNRKDFGAVHCMLPSPSFSVVSASCSIMKKETLATFSTPLFEFSWLKNPKVRTRQGLVHFFLKNKIFALPVRKRVRSVVSTEFQKEQMLSLGAKDEDVRVLPNGIDLERFAPCDRKKARKDLGISAGSDDFVVSYLGHFGTAKGVPDLVSAMKSVAASRDDVRLALAWTGFGQDADRITKMIEGDERLKERTTLLGRVDVRKFMAASDVTVLPYIYPFGTYYYPPTALEAFAVGTPVISTNTGCMPELIRSGENGVLVEPSSPEQLSSEIISLLDDRKKRAKISAAARKTVEERHDIRKVAREYAGEYERLSSR